MSEDNTTVAVAETVVQAERGEVGVATASLTVKSLWHKQLAASVRNGNALSLRAFVRQLAKSGDANVATLAKEWFGNKAGAKNQKRSAANVAAAKAAGAATKLGRKKSKGGGKAKATTEAAA